MDYYKVFEEIDNELQAISHQRLDEGQLGLIHTEVNIVGQFSLFLCPELKDFDIGATSDIDLFYKGDLKVFDLFKKFGILLRIDYDGDLIRYPENFKFINFYQGSKLTINRLDPVSVLISKALGNINKNKPLLKKVINSNIFPNLIEELKKYDEINIREILENE